MKNLKLNFLELSLLGLIFLTGCSTQAPKYDPKGGSNQIYLEQNVDRWSNPLNFDSCYSKDKFNDLYFLK